MKDSKVRAQEHLDEALLQIETAERALRKASVELLELPLANEHWEVTVYYAIAIKQFWKSVNEEIPRELVDLDHSVLGIGENPKK